MGSDIDLFDAIRGQITSGGDWPAVERSIWGRFGTHCAVMVVDSSGFTRVAQERGILHFLACLVRLRDVMIPVMVRHGAVGPRAEADNFYAVFDTPAAALNAALATNAALVEAGLLLTETEPFRVCTGIGYGDVLRSHREGVFGREMNLASKLGEDLAEAGEILLSSAAFEALDPEHQPLFEKRHAGVSGVSFPYYVRTAG